MEAASTVPVVVEGFKPAGVLRVAAVVVIVGLLLKPPKPRRSASTLSVLSARGYTRRRQYRPRRFTEKNLVEGQSETKHANKY